MAKKPRFSQGWQNYAPVYATAAVTMSATASFSASFYEPYNRAQFVAEVGNVVSIVDECKVDEDEAIAIFIKAINDRPKRAKR